MRILPLDAGSDVGSVFSVMSNYMLYHDLAEDDPQRFVHVTNLRLHRWYVRASLRDNPNRTFTAEEVTPLSIYDIRGIEREDDHRYEIAYGVGKIFLNVWRLDNSNFGGSVNKSIYLIENTGEVSASHLRKIWGKSKPVAHICAAYALILDSKGINAVGLSDDAIEEFVLSQQCPKDTEIQNLSLAITMYFYDYALNRIDPRNKSSLLSAEKAWIFPRQCVPSDMRNLSPACPPLSANEVTAMRKYKANNRF